VPLPLAEGYLLAEALSLTLKSAIAAMLGIFLEKMSLETWLQGVLTSQYQHYHQDRVIARVHERRLGMRVWAQGDTTVVGKKEALGRILAAAWTSLRTSLCCCRA